MGFMSACGISRRAASIALLLPLGLLATQPATADWGKLLKDTAKRAVERETSRQVDRKITETIRCTVGQYDCYEQAQRDGWQVVYVDQHGNVITGADGQPVDNPPGLKQRRKMSSI